MTIVAAILVFCILILSHEFGHFAIAKLCKVHVYSFNLGMGPKLLKWRRKETEYCIRLFPIGGSCQMMGEDEDNDSEGSFNTKKVWQRIAIIAGGPILNFITAILLFVIVFMAVGVGSSTNVVGTVLEDGSAAAAGILPGDRIVEINGLTVEDWAGITTGIGTAMEASAGTPVDVVVERGAETLTLTMTPYYNAEYDQWMIGIQQSVERYNLFGSIRQGVVQSYEFTKQLLVALFQMITGKMEVDVGGPVAVVTVIGQAAANGLQTVLMIAAILSINLGVINLLPVPALDGARIVFLVIEGIRGKPISREKEGMVHFVGLMLLFALMIVITYKDIMRLIGS